MITIVRKCSGKRCKEVFHIYDNVHPLYTNDIGYIEVKCSHCGKISKIPVHNPVPFGFGDNYEVVSSHIIESEEEWNALKIEVGNTITLVEGYENRNETIHEWRTYSDKHFWKCGELNLEELADQALQPLKGTIKDFLYSFKQAYLAGQLWAAYNERLFIVQKYEYEGKTFKAVWAKEVKSEHDFEFDGLYLVHHNCNDPIDGIYSRDELLLYLERLLVRWKILCSHIVIASPFIGFDMQFSKPEDKKEIIYLWRLLNGLLDSEKTTFLTRANTYSSLKKAQSTFEINPKELKQWDLMFDLQRKFDNKNTRDKAAEQFHAKIYAGIFNNEVELFSGSYNIQSGPILENMTLNSISKESFISNYMKRVMSDFTTAEGINPNVVCYVIDENNNTSYETILLSDFINKYID